MKVRRKEGESNSRKIIIRQNLKNHAVYIISHDKVTGYKTSRDKQIGK